MIHKLAYLYVFSIFVYGFDGPIEKRMGPVFISEPPSSVDFLNTTGVAVDCLAFGSPSPRISWRLRDGSLAENVPGLRQTLPNGTLILWSFRPEQYRQDVHADVYRCLASNVVGTILSRDIHVRGVVKQYYEVQVYDEYVIRGNTAVLTCHIPSFVKDYVTVTSWIRDDIVTITSNVQEGGRYSVFSSGELHIRNVTPSDGSMSYRCQTTHRLTNEIIVSATAGRLIVTDSSGTVPPRITDSRSTLPAVQGNTIELPCAAQGFPVPRYSWYKYAGRNNSQLLSVYLDSRMTQLSGSLIIRQVKVEDEGKYVCLISNSAGEERTEMVLVVTAHLSAHVQPQQQTIDVGKTAKFNCSYSGHPVNSITWIKDGNPMFEDGIRVKVLSRNVLIISSVRREDSGMYQCFVSNEVESAQGTAQLLLGDATPVFHYVFSEETLQPGPFVSLKCVASGNPLPQITWTLDGSLLPEDQRYRIGDYITLQGHVVSYVNITSVRVEDGGVYECHAKNTMGTISHSSRLNVYGLPYIRPMKDVSAVAGESLVLRCHVAGYPIDTITWSRDGSRMPINRRQEMFPNGTLVIRDVQRGVDDGSYKCRALNRQGQSATGTVRVHVMVKPVIDPFSFPRNLQEGMRSRLVCTVIQGDPPFVIHWRKDRRPIEPGLGVGIRNDDFSSDLTFASVSPRHNGNYTCIVSNAAASVSHTATLIVDVPPRWNVEPRDESVVSGQNVRIDCLADGFPTPVITWERGSVSSPHHYTVIASGPHYEVYANGSLLIKNVEEDDGGYYLCQATNGIASGLSKVVFLTVHVPPRFETKFKSETVKKNEMVKMQCSASGDHPMTIVWNIDKQPLNPTEEPRYSIKDYIDKKRLSSEITIMSAERRDSALFTCLVTNAFGRDDMNIRLIVQEPPEPPREIKILEQKSRSTKISWSPPFTGNSAIIKYHIQCKQESGNDRENVINVTAGSDDTKVVLKGLRPARTYYCRIRAENSVGLGEPSEPTAITTSEEVPGGPPLDVKVQAIDSQSLKVTWKPPDHELWNGPIKGYYVGYKVYDSEDPYLYKTLEVGQGIEEQVVLNQLHKFTRYSVLVQAYNSMGAGPRSDEIIVRTLEDVPSQPPHRVQCLPLTSQSLHISWEAPPMSSIHGILQGYKILYRPAETLAGDEEYEEKRVTEQDAKLTSLHKYTNYSIMVVAFTQKGYGVRSNPVYCMTLEDVPGPPAAVKSVVLSSDTILVTWKHPLLSNGIINKYSLYWRSLSDIKNATVVHIPASQNQYKVTGLKENSRHEFWLTASTARGEGEISKVVSGTTTSWLPARILGFGETVVTTPGEKVVLTCQSIGNPPLHRNWKLRGETIPKQSRIEVLSDGALIIRQLQITDSGNYTCYVRNKHGSDEITYSLIIQGIFLSHAPQIKIISASTTSVHVELLFTMPENVILRGYEVHYKAENKEWQQRRISGKNHTFMLDGLECGASYHLYVVALTSEGKGERSNPVVFRTESTVPVAPKQEDMIFTNSTHLVLQLLSWQSGRCPITKMIIEYRPQSSTHWTLLTNRVVPEQQNQIIIQDLNPETWYVIRVTAYNAAGSTVAEYDVITLKVSGVVSVSDAGNPDHLPAPPPFFEDTTTLVSMASSGVVLIAGVVAVVCLVMYKRRRNTRHHYRESSSRSDVATTTALMAHLEKKSQRSETSRQSHSHSRDLPSYFSSPVRKVVPTANPPSSRQLPHSSSSSHYYEDEIAPYATFQLPGPTPEEDEGQTEEFKTFSVHHGEPPYLAKTSLDPPSAKSGKASEELYQSQAPNSHSLTSGSSNQEELMRAYEYARRHPPPALQYDGIHNRGQSHTSGTGTTESEGTDPGIRQFSGTPPKPNERRQGACLTPGVSVGASAQTAGNESSTSDEATPVNTPYQARPMPSAQPREKGQLSWGGMKNRSQATSKKTNSKGIKKGLSSDESDSEGTIYTFSRADTVVLRGSSGNEVSETECDRDRITHLSRSGFSRRPPARSHTKSDVIDC
ncbi:cell adhesion molecule Dscam1-like [Centruroides vittatus]|uniref:cell adhesion molecule Dscam1-like n=1 Tax=Centruroides vittatus TaxID=120091 RepID=UPI0035106039